jgi:hypothetical protein
MTVPGFNGCATATALVQVRRATYELCDVVEGVAYLMEAPYAR